MNKKANPNDIRSKTTRQVGNHISSSSLFDLSDRVAVITGAAGLLGVKHAEAIAEFGGNPVLVDIKGEEVIERANELSRSYNVKVMGEEIDMEKKKVILFDKFVNCYYFLDNEGNEIFLYER